MVMESETSSGFGLDSSDKVKPLSQPPNTSKTTTILNDEKINGGGNDTTTPGFYLKLQRTESFPYKMIINQNDSNEGFSSFRENGSSFCSSEDESRFSAGVGFNGGGGAVGRTFQGFNSNAFKSPVGMTTRTLKFPFTSAQYQELERQALIYKYMMHCVPIPTDLLLPMTRNLSPITSSHSTLGRSSSYMRFSKNIDPEPGRCRRTDGKKWRCSRDVAPDQKYCERHMHRSRPRSRKHVEIQTEINNKINHFVPPLSIPSGFSLNPHFNVPPFQSMASSSSSSPYKDNTRNSEWMMRRDATSMASSSNHQLEQMMNSKQRFRTNINGPVFHQQYQETEQRNDQFGLFLNPELTSLDENLNSDERQTPTRFIDAWSTGRVDGKPTEITTNNSSVFASNKFSPSNLSLSMSGCNSTEEEIQQIDQIEMGLGLKSQTLSWMDPVSWTNSQPGGPLGEVLQSSTTKGSKSSINGGGLNLMTDGNWFSNVENSSPRLTTISSPSGVLQKTLASLSDSSGNSSPNSMSAAAKSEFAALQLLNQSKLYQPSSF